MLKFANNRVFGLSSAALGGKDSVSNAQEHNFVLPFKEWNYSTGAEIWYKE